MSVACVRVDHFPFKLEAARRSALGKRRGILYKRSGSQHTVVDVSPGIEHVPAGMPLQEAQARCKDAVLVEADMPRYEQAFTRMLVRLGDWSPVVEAASLGCAYVGLDGLERTYGSEARLIAVLLQAVPRYLGPCLGVSQSKFPAYLAAIAAQPNTANKTPAELSDFLAPFSVDVLPVPWEMKSRLRSFGLHTLGQIASLPIGPIQAQFGPAGARVWHLAQGVDETPLIPRQPKEEVSDEVTFAVATANLGPLLMAIEVLLSQLFGRAEMRGRFSRTALIEGHVMNGPTWQRRIVFKTPVGDKSRGYTAIKASLGDLTLPGPLEDISLALTNLTGEVGRQESLFQDVRRTERMREAIAQLKVSQGRNPLYRIRQVEPWSRIPERQMALMPFEP